jgi:hypothetical protein
MRILLLFLGLALIGAGPAQVPDVAVRSCWATLDNFVTQSTTPCVMGSDTVRTVIDAIYVDVYRLDSTTATQAVFVELIPALFAHGAATEQQDNPLILVPISPPQVEFSGARWIITSHGELLSPKITLLNTGQCLLVHLSRYTGQSQTQNRPPGIIKARFVVMYRMYPVPSGGASGGTNATCT